jgi:hypothetical protein
MKSRLNVGGNMQRQKTGIIARRLGQSMTFGRFAAWLSFAGAVLGQAALLAACYFLSDPSAPNALRNAAIAGLLAVIGFVVMAVARRAAKRAQAHAGMLGRVPLRLVPHAEPKEPKREARPAA